MQTRAVVLSGGYVVDGTGAPPVSGEVVIQGSRIVFAGNRPAAGSIVNCAECDVLDCERCIVAPGFIDAHSHSDLQILQDRTEKLL
jgi:N-acyl-D-aspartate/D-glutamate deacylase